MPDEQPDEPAVTPAPPDEPAVTGTPVPPEGTPAPGVDTTPVPGTAGAAEQPSATAEASAPVVDEAAVPDEETLARIASPVLVRRAPRYGAFIGYGAVLGFVVGVVLAIALDRGDLVAAGEGGGVLPFLGGSNGARLVTGVGLAGVGALVGALLALWADARSRRLAR